MFRRVDKDLEILNKVEMLRCTHAQAVKEHVRRCRQRQSRVFEGEVAYATDLLAQRWQPCADLLSLLTATGYQGVVVAEIKTNRAPTKQDRLADLAESLAFARRHLALAASPAAQG